MPHFCCVVGCSNRSNRSGREIKFYRIPSVLKFKHKTKLNELSALRREKWIQAIRRSDLKPESVKNARVCSKHFLNDKPAQLTDTLDPDWVPSVNMGYKISEISSSNSKVDRHHRSVKRVKVAEMKLETRPEEEQLDTETGNGLDSPNNVKEIQTKITFEQITEMLFTTTLNRELKMKLNKVALTVESLLNDDMKTRYYTGLPTYKVFEVVLKYINPYIRCHLNTALSANEQILLTLVKLRLNLDYKDLAYRFGVSLSTASMYFKNVLHVLFLRFKNFVFWPERDILQKTMPSCFKECFHDKTTVIIDCFEIRTETPSKLVTAAQSWSSYKHSKTIKYLIGITPQGSICFISEGWGGRVSDKFLTENSSFLNYLLPGDVVMADRGFLIKEFVEIFNATVKIPAFTRGKTQLHPVDLESTRAIAHVRIHVERVIGLIRQKFRISDEVLSIQMLCTGGDEPILDEIVFVCCALINICPPIVPL